MTFEEIYKNDRFANNLGITLQVLCDEHAAMTMRVEQKHLNGANTAHGGAIFTLIDITMAAMANFKQPISLSIQSDVKFLAVAFEGDLLTATAECTYSQRRMCYCRVSVANQNGELIAIADGMFHIKKNAIL